MDTVAVEYIRAMATKFRYFPTWLPGNVLKLGDYGVMENAYSFRRIGNISNLGIQFTIREDSQKDDLSHSSKQGITWSIEASGNTTVPSAELKTKAVYEFSRKGSFVFEARGIRLVSIEEQSTVGNEILKKFRNRDWDKNRKVITELGVADSATILISGSSSGKLEITADGDLPNVDIADAKLGLKVTWSRDMETSYIAKSGLTPFFRISGIRHRGPFLPPIFDPITKYRSPFSVELIPDADLLKQPDSVCFGGEDMEDLLTKLSTE